VYAIIDIETCGGKYINGSGKITEICILIHNGVQVIDKFTSLVHPECYISDYYTQITGITNAMVADAPKFYEISKRIVELTTNCVFVAHNVSFDYNFIKNEFAALGYNYDREQLCTVKLSRKLLPGFSSYSLGVLCDGLEISNNARHRAEGDAVATAKLFDILIKTKNNSNEYALVPLTEVTMSVKKIRPLVLEQTPPMCGVYYFMNEADEIIYIGKSINMYQRAVSHFASKEAKTKAMINELHSVKHVVTGSEGIALLLESNEIKALKPKYNRLRKTDNFTHCINYSTNNEGVIVLKVSTMEKATNALGAFANAAKAKDYLELLLDENRLCQTYCIATASASMCFNHQIKKCNGICVGEESIVDYNVRVQKIIDKYSFNPKHFFITDKGRHANENALIMVLNGKYYGYGYVDKEEQITSREQLMEYITDTTYFADTDALLRGWISECKIKIKQC
jgi:DNA polymerase III subunit epsilon